MAHLLAGCGVDAGPDGEAGSQQSALDGVASVVASPPELMQSETVQAVSAVNGQTFQLISFNDFDVPPFVEYPNASDRIVRGDASLLAWGIKRPQDSSWSIGKIFPDTTNTIAVFWGDPSLAASGPNVFLSNVVARRDLFSGEVHGSMEDSLQGACVARSVDGGFNFRVADEDCPVSNNDFYDGSALQLSSTGQDVFAAYLDFDRSQIHVWRGGTTYPFTGVTGGGLAPIPFPGLAIISHPRMAWSQGNLVLAAIDSSHRLLVTTYTPEFPSWSTPLVVATDAQDGPATVIGSKTIRGAAGFSMAITPLASLSDTPRLLVWYTKTGGTTRQLQGVRCTLAPPSCTAPSAWRTSSSSNAFSPAVAANLTPAGAPNWRVSYYTDEQSPNQVRIAGGTFASGVGFSSFSRKLLTSAQTPCPDLRGYWGDYDDMITDPAPHSGSRPFVRSFTDSSGAACTQAMFHSVPQHISQVSVP